MFLTIFISTSYVTVHQSKLLSDVFTQAQLVLGRGPEETSFTGMIGVIPTSAGIALGHHNKGNYLPVSLL